jgi:hypothetical protein
MRKIFLPVILKKRSQMKVLGIDNLIILRFALGKKGMKPWRGLFRLWIGNWWYDVVNTVTSICGP